jgi:hypothetical protein
MELNHLFGLAGKARKAARNAFRRNLRRHQDSSNWIAGLPNDCWAIIIRFLNDVEANKFARVCQTFYLLVVNCGRTVFHPNIRFPLDTWKIEDMGIIENPNCAIDSKSCTETMSDVKDLCKWHRRRMAQYWESSCKCNQWIVCDGDATGRNMFRNYYNDWTIPVIDLFGKFYCCGACQNGDSEKYFCGHMRVGNCCKHRHKSECLTRKYGSSYDWSDSNSGSDSDSE